MEELAVLNSLPIEIIVYFITVITIVLVFLSLKKCDYSIENLVCLFIEEEVGLTLSQDMDLSFIFPKIISYIEYRLDKEKKRPTNIRIALLILKSKFIQTIVIKYIRIRILPRLIEDKL